MVDEFNFTLSDGDGNILFRAFAEDTEDGPRLRHGECYLYGQKDGTYTVAASPRPSRAQELWWTLWRAYQGIRWSKPVVSGVRWIGKGRK